MGLSMSFGLIPLLNPDELINGISAHDMVGGLFMTGIGLLSFWVGYAIISRYSLEIRNSETSGKINLDFKNPSYFATILIYVGLSLFRINLIFRGGGTRYGAEDVLNLGVWEQWLTYLITARYFFVAMFAIQHARKQWSIYSLVFSLIIEVFVALISGWSSELIKLSIVVIGIHTMYNRKIPISYLVGAALLISLFVPVIRNFRTVEVGSIASVSQGFETTNALFTFQSRIDFVEELLFSRQIGSSQIPALLLAKTPDQVGFRPIRELLLSPFAFLPRILWSDKPAYGTIGQYIAAEYLGLEGHGSSAITPAGGFYIYGGYGAVVFGMLFTGIGSALFSRIIYIRAISNSGVTFLALYIGAVLRVFHLSEGGFVSVTSVLIQTALVYLLIAIAISIRIRGSSINTSRYSIPKNTERPT